MGLRVDETVRTAEAATWIDEWPLPSRPHFMVSRAFDVVCRELDRYVRQEVAGRSLLISGHRGAGKTTLVTRAVDDIGRAMIERTIRQAKAGDAGSLNLHRPQRPLLVKLHGPSLLADLPDRPKPSAAEGDSSSSEPKNSAASSQRTDAIAQHALKQLTLALYRALAREVSHGFSIHARELQARQPAGSRHNGYNDFLELAGQLKLELDQGPDPALLRSYWHRLGRLRAGVLWPGAVGRLFDDQGMREVVAVATAAQAYRICVGSVSDKRNEKASRTAERTAEGKGELALKEMVNALGAPLVGGLVGAAAYAQSRDPAMALAAGLGSSLLSGLTMTWSAKRSSRQEHAVEYSFIRNTEIQTLDRDLPLIIERIREAGLSPVFLVDELDKMPKCEEIMESLIGRLKHLIADSGFFCFLTDHEYFTKFRETLKKSKYSVEHTYFSDWIYVRYRSVDAYGYLDRILQVDRRGRQGNDPDGNRPYDSGETPSAAEQFTRSVLGSVMLHRSRLNMMDFHREITKRCSPDGRILEELSEGGNPRYYQVPVSIQLAIEHLLEDDGLRPQIDREPEIAQIIVDALYMPSLAWEEGRQEVDLGRHALAAFILNRLRDDVDREKAPSEDEVISRMGRSNWDLLVGVIARLAELLTDASKLRASVSKMPSAADHEAIMPWPDNVLAGMPEPVLRAVDGEPNIYRFTYDSLGREHSGVVEPSRSGERRAPDNFGEYLSFAQHFIRVLKELGVDSRQLQEIGLLPPSVATAQIQLIYENLPNILEGLADTDFYYDDVEKLRQFVDSVIEQGPQITAMLRLARHVAYELDCKTGAVLSADFIMIFMPFMMEGRIDNMPKFLRENFLEISMHSYVEWSERFVEFSRRLDVFPGRFDANTGTMSAWSLWKNRVTSHLVSPSSNTDNILYSEIVLFAKKMPPSTLFKFRMERMTCHDWSKVAARAFVSLDEVSSDIPFPFWSLLVSLDALGFSRSVFQDACNRPWRNLRGRSFEDDQLAERFSKRPRPDVPGIVLRMKDTNSMAERIWRSRNMPVIALRSDEIDEYGPFLLWLGRLGAIGGVTNEQ